jgi:hypothetical protein
MRKMKVKKPIERKGIAYFPTFQDAREHGRSISGFPAWRVVSYGLGWAVQAYPSGPYFNLKGQING